MLSSFGLFFFPLYFNLNNFCWFIIQVTDSLRYAGRWISPLEEFSSHLFLFLTFLFYSLYSAQWSAEILCSVYVWCFNSSIVVVLNPWCLSHVWICSVDCFVSWRQDSLSCLFLCLMMFYWMPDIRKGRVETGIWIWLYLFFSQIVEVMLGRIESVWTGT